MSDTSSVTLNRKRFLQSSANAFHRLDVPELAGDNMDVRQFARCWFGSDDRQAIRSAYHLLEKSKAIPAAKLSGKWSIRLSSLRATIWAQESRSWSEPETELLVRTHILLSAVLPLLADLNTGIASTAQMEQLEAVLAETVPTIEQLIGGKAVR
jgi:hypothetical protein